MCVFTVASLITSFAAISGLLTDGDPATPMNTIELAITLGLLLIAAMRQR